MNIRVRKYNPPEDYEKILNLIKSEGEEWKDYLSPKYEVNLKESITYVAYIDNILCGYSRSLNDFGFYIWVVDLLIRKKNRGNSIGKKILDAIVIDYPNTDIYIMSDIDEYYEKIEYKKEGSIYRVE